MKTFNLSIANISTSNVVINLADYLADVPKFKIQYIQVNAYVNLGIFSDLVFYLDKEYKLIDYYRFLTNGLSEYTVNIFEIDEKGLIVGLNQLLNYDNENKFILPASCELYITFYFHNECDFDKIQEHCPVK